MQIGQDIDDNQHPQGKDPTEPRREKDARAKGQGVSGGKILAGREAEEAGHRRGHARPHGNGQDEHQQYGQQ